MSSDKTFIFNRPNAEVMVSEHLRKVGELLKAREDAMLAAEPDQHPQLLNFVVAACLILTGVVGLNGLYHFVR